MLFTIVKSIDGWLQVDPENVAVVHCKGGKGRTGLVICCWLIYSAICLHPDEALTMFAEKRSSTGRGVKQPSQKRYIEYFYSLLVTDMPVVTRVMEMKRVMIGPFSEGTELILEITTYEGTNKENKIFTGLSRCDETSPCGESIGILPEKTSGSLDKRMIVFNVNSRVSRDLLITVKRKKKIFFHLNFNTMFTQAVKHTRQILPSEFDKYDAKTHGSNIVLAIEFDKVSEEPDDEMASMIETIKLDFVPRFEKEKARREKEAAAAAAFVAEANSGKEEEEMEEGEGEERDGKKKKEKKEREEKEEEEGEKDGKGEECDGRNVVTLKVPPLPSRNDSGESNAAAETPKKRRSGSFSAMFEKRRNQSKRRSLTLKKSDDGKSVGKEGSEKERDSKSDYSDDENDYGKVKKFSYLKSDSPDTSETKWVSSKPRPHQSRFRPLFSSSSSSLPPSSPKMLSPRSGRRGGSVIYHEDTK